MVADTASAVVVILSRDARTVARLTEHCRRERLAAVRVATGEEVAAVVRGNGADVVVIDRALPDEDGFDTIRRLRRESDVPVVLLSENGGGVDEEVGLALGADDVVPRSVPARLFVARVKALLRRVQPARPRSLLRIGALELDGLRVRASVEGRDVGLTLAEFRLLEALVRLAGGVLSRRRLLEAVSAGAEARERTVDVHVANIRRKLARHGLGEVLETVRGVGYRVSASRTMPSAAGEHGVSLLRDGGP